LVGHDGTLFYTDGEAGTPLHRAWL